MKHILEVDIQAGMEIFEDIISQSEFIRSHFKDDRDRALLDSVILSAQGLAVDPNGRFKDRVPEFCAYDADGRELENYQIPPHKIFTYRKFASALVVAQAFNMAATEVFADGLQDAVNFNEDAYSSEAFKAAFKEVKTIKHICDFSFIAASILGEGNTNWFTGPTREIVTRLTAEFDEALSRR